MPNTLLARIAGRLCGPDDPPDHALLGRFTADRDAEAFALLVARHGPMVLGVCRRVLGNAPDADDAFQAAFLVLVRRAADLRHQDRLAGWLYGVAYRTALEARTGRAKRRRRETPTAELPDVPAADPLREPELAAAVERELAALPDHYRTALALCDLGGRSRADAAARLGIPEGTLSSRLNAGRKLLAARLTRCGYGAAAVALAAPNAPALPWPLVETTVRAATGAPNPTALSLTDGVMRAMTAKRNLWAVVLTGMFAVGVAGTAVAFAATPTRPVTRTAGVTADPPEGGDKKVSDARPVIVKTVPEAGAEGVDPASKEVRVTFSKKMTDQSWSWAQDLGYGAALPSGGNKPVYDKDGKTCVLGVKLEPNTTYAVWLNAGKFMSFVDTDGNPAVPYLLVFRTGNGK
jgi:RNA polymerase sigma-70 factor (ECF subfamily)